MMKRIPNDETAAICGLFCGTCPSFPEECHGCLSDKLTSHCVTCSNGFRDCAREHGVVRCYECEQFPCAKLQHFQKQHHYNGIGHHENVINDLQTMKQKGVTHWVKEQTEKHTCKSCNELVYWYEVHQHRCK